MSSLIKILKAGAVSLIITLLVPVVVTMFQYDDALFMNIAHAQEDSSAEKASKRKTRRTPALREKTYKKLSNAQELIEKEEFAAALKMLNTVKSDSSLNSYERAMAWNFTAYAYSIQEKYPQALNAFEKVLAQPDLPEALEINTLYSMGQLYLASEQYTKSIQTFKKWFRLARNPGASAYVFLAQAYYQLEDFKSVVREVEKAMKVNKVQGGGAPNEQWLLLLRAGYFELGNTKKVIETLEMLTNLYPKGEYFAQLSGQYGEIGDEKKQLLTLESAYDGKYFSKENEYLSLASLLINNDVPYKAAKILTEGMNKDIVKENVSNLRMLAQAWHLAQEPRESIQVLQKASKKSDDGELYVRLGRAYADLDEWDNCSSAIRSGLKKGGIKRSDSANVVLGVCLYNKDKLDNAITAFERARKDKRSEKVAIQWLNFLRTEKDRRQRLANSLL